MKKTCAETGVAFEISEREAAFCEKIAVPLPELCYEERQRRRLAWKNERTFYTRTCDGTGQRMLSVFAPEYPGQVYCPAHYWGDEWSGGEFGRAFDFSRPFFEQFHELLLAVPQLGLILKDHEQSDYCNDAIRLKSCYLIFDGEQARDCLYGETFAFIEDCLDFLFLEHSRWCYECVNCQNCHELRFSYHCQNCSESWFLRDCVGCRNCFGCSNLRQKQYWIYNKPHTKEEYEEFLQGFDSGSHAVITKLKDQAHHFWETGFAKFQRGVQNENVTGDHITHSKDCQHCFDVNNLRDCGYCTNMLLPANDCWDLHIWGGKTNYCYNSCGVGEGAQNIRFCHYCWSGVQNLDYCYFCCNNSKDCFGCVNLVHSQYRILNQQYSAAEYEDLREKIIDHMKSTGEWGQFFPIQYSPFAYNESQAQEHFPLTRTEVLERGWRWRDEDKQYQPQTVTLPDRIDDVPDSICDAVLACEVTGKNFKIQKKELQFYRRMNLPLPRLCPDRRHLDRLALRNPRTLYTRQCAASGVELQTTFAPDRPEKILSEEEYWKVVE